MPRRPAKRDVAPARRVLLWAAVGTLACWVTLAGLARAEDGASNHAKERVKRSRPAERESPPAEDPLHVQGPPGSVQLPTHTKGDTGRVSDPRTLHGDAKIAAASTTLPADEHAVGQIHSTHELEPAPFVETAAAGGNQPNTSAAPTFTAASSPSDAGPQPDARAAAPEAVAVAVDPKASPHEPAEPVTLPPRTGALRAATAPAAPNEGGTPADSATTEMTVFDQIRLEIKRRLPHFQSCAHAARRRSGLDIRRVQLTWAIAADGTIKSLKVEDNIDAQLAACLSRAGSRPFTVQPGMDLTIPTPIVFVR